MRVSGGVLHRAPRRARRRLRAARAHTIKPNVRHSTRAGQVTNSDHWFARTGRSRAGGDRLHLGSLVTALQPLQRRARTNVEGWRHRAGASNGSKSYPYGFNVTTEDG